MTNLSTDQKQLLARIEDLYDQAIFQNRNVATPFLDETQLMFIEKRFSNKINMQRVPSYPLARRARIAFLCTDFEENDFVVCLVAKVSKKFVQLTHRDLLGSLMALKIDRNQFGDMFVQDDKIVVYCTKHIASVVIEQCTQIHKTNVHFEVSDQHYEPEQIYERFTINIASFRLDNIVSSLVPCSRQHAQDMITEGLVKVNHEIIEESTKLCHNRDTISITKVGRFEIASDGNLTRKGRFVVEIKKYC